MSNIEQGMSNVEVEIAAVRSLRKLAVGLTGLAMTRIDGGDLRKRLDSQQLSAIIT